MLVSILCRGVAVAALLASSQLAVPTAVYPAANELPPFANAAARAAFLHLPAPAVGPTAAAPFCARAINAEFVACFPEHGQPARFVQGDSSTMTLTGNGGTSLTSTTTGYLMVETCDAGPGNYFPCSYNDNLWYAAVTSYNYCTHTYVNNDYFKEYVPAFNMWWRYSAADALNCNKQAAYPNDTQGGAGSTFVTKATGQWVLLGPGEYKSLSFSYN